MSGECGREFKHNKRKIKITNVSLFLKQLQISDMNVGRGNEKRVVMDGIYVKKMTLCKNFTLPNLIY